MQRLQCPHCEREFEMEKPGPCPGCAELGHTGANIKRCAACKADGHSVHPVGEKGARRPVKRPRAARNAIETAAPVTYHRNAVRPERLPASTVASTLRGLAGIANTPYAQKTAEDLLLACIADPDVIDAYQPFRRRPG